MASYSEHDRGTHCRFCGKFTYDGTRHVCPALHPLCERPVQAFVAYSPSCRLPRKHTGKCAA